MSQSSMQIRLNVSPSQVRQIDNETLAIDIPCQCFDPQPIAQHLESELQDLPIAEREYIIGHTLASCQDALRVAAISSLIRKER